MALAEAGMDVVRLNFSYGSHESHAAVIGEVRAVSEQIGRPLAVLQDLCGPKLRVGEIPGGDSAGGGAGGDVERGGVAARRRPPLPLPELQATLKAGDRLLLSDGRIELRVLGVSGPEIRCETVNGGVLKSHQGVNVPDTALPIGLYGEGCGRPGVRAGARGGLGGDVLRADGGGFRRAAGAHRGLRQARRSDGEDQDAGAVHHLEEIVGAADGVMVTRGDLGVETTLDQVPIVQKRIIALGNRLGRPVVTATQMLESMIVNPRHPGGGQRCGRPGVRRDGRGDAVRGNRGGGLSGRGGAGDGAGSDRGRPRSTPALTRDAFRDLPCETITDAIAEAAVSLAEDLSAQAIITPTSSGTTTVMVAEHRQKAPVWWRLPKAWKLSSGLALVWGVYPLPPRHARKAQTR